MYIGQSVDEKRIDLAELFFLVYPLIVRIYNNSRKHKIRRMTISTMENVFLLFA